MKEFCVNVDIGFELDGQGHPLGSTFRADETRKEVAAAVKSGRLVPVEGARDAEKDDAASMLKESDEPMRKNFDKY